jgi:ComF family protein
MPLLNDMLSLVAPHECVGCGNEGHLLCVNCSQSLPRVPSRCYICHAATTNHKVCQKCRHKSKLTNLWVHTLFEAEAEKLVKKYKFGFAQSAATDIARAMAGTLPFELDFDVVLPVPTATSRIRNRGFDHAELLSKRVAHYTGIRHENLMRRLTQDRQVGAGRKQRFAQLEGAFVLCGNGRLFGRRVLLVDDIVTSGATLESAAVVLKKHGVKQVSAVVFAQKS